ncbi:Gustatory receptor 152a [Halyomorpha halys]|nr:Gustatory receptor 152a [Halyomorpha halys]
MLDHRKTTIDPEVVKHFNKTSRGTMLLGGFPLKLKNDDLIISFWGLSTFFFMISLLLACAVIQVCYRIRENAYLNIVECILVWLDYFLLHLAVFVCIYNTIRKRRLVFNIIQQLSHMKIFLERSGILWKPKSKISISLFLTIVIVSLKVYQPFMFRISLGYAGNFTAFYYLIIMVIWIVCQFMWFADFLTHCFGGLASCAKRTDCGYELERLMKLHYLLTTASNQLSSLYSFLLTVSYIAFFFMSLTRAYLIVTKRQFNGSLFMMFIMGLNAIWTVILVFLCYSIVSSCEQVTHKAKKFDAALYRLLVYKSPARVTQNMTTLKLFFHFSGKPEVVFTLSGFLKLDWNLLYSMMAAGCAYLIVIIQLNHFI